MIIAQKKRKPFNRFIHSIHERDRSNNSIFEWLVVINTIPGRKLNLCKSGHEIIANQRKTNRDPTKTHEFRDAHHNDTLSGISCNYDWVILISQFFFSLSLAQPLTVSFQRKISKYQRKPFVGIGGLTIMRYSPFLVFLFHNYFQHE